MNQLLNNTLKIYSKKHSFSSFTWRKESDSLIIKKNSKLTGIKPLISDSIIMKWTNSLRFKSMKMIFAIPHSGYKIRDRHHFINRNFYHTINSCNKQTVDKSSRTIVPYENKTLIQKMFNSVATNTFEFAKNKNTKNDISIMNLQRNFWSCDNKNWPKENRCGVLNTSMWINKYRVINKYLIDDSKSDNHKHNQFEKYTNDNRHITNFIATQYGYSQGYSFQSYKTIHYTSLKLMNKAHYKKDTKCSSYHPYFTENKLSLKISEDTTNKMNKSDTVNYITYLENEHLLRFKIKDDISQKYAESKKPAKYLISALVQKNRNQYQKDMVGIFTTITVNNMISKEMIIGTNYRNNVDKINVLNRSGIKKNYTVNCIGLTTMNDRLTGNAYADVYRGSHYKIIIDRKNRSINHIYINEKLLSKKTITINKKGIHNLLRKNVHGNIIIAGIDFKWTQPQMSLNRAGLKMDNQVRYTRMNKETISIYKKFNEQKTTEIKNLLKIDISEMFHQKRSCNEFSDITKRKIQLVSKLEFNRMYRKMTNETKKYSIFPPENVLNNIVLRNDNKKNDKESQLDGDDNQEIIQKKSLYKRPMGISDVPTTMTMSKESINEYADELFKVIEKRYLHEAKKKGLIL